MNNHATFKKKKILQPLQICIGPTISIGRGSWCVPYVGFFLFLLIVLDVEVTRVSTEYCTVIK